MSERVIAALSGGVDSSVAAVLLVERGYEVTGMMLRLWAERGTIAASAGDSETNNLPTQTRAGTESRPYGAIVGAGLRARPERLRARPERKGLLISSGSANRCCTPDAVERARRVAAQLGISFHLIDAQDTFKQEVVDYFIAEYASGRTPNPCIHCNRIVRFGILLEQAQAMGADFIATGHYARVRRVDERYQLLRGRDRWKDQSYFLHSLTQEQLAHIKFPLGELTKEEVREIARQRGLPVAEQPESQDICFVADGDYRRFLAERFPELMRTGPILDTSGQVLGRHQGLPAYTIGQRKGLGISAPEPLYVLAIEPEENALVVGPADELGRDHCRVEKMHYISGETPNAPFRATAQIRYRARPTAVTVTPLSQDEAEVHFNSPQRDITPGQFLVLYEEKGNVVLGGGVICRPQQAML